MTPAVRLFSVNWFSRHEDVPPLTDVETDLINAALGPVPQRWDGESDVARLAAIVAEHPLACDRIGARLLKVAVGMRGCGGAVRFLLERGVALDAEGTVYNVLHEAAWAARRIRCRRSSNPVRRMPRRCLSRNRTPAGPTTSP